MPAILVVKGIKYACNLDSKGDLICLQSWLQRVQIMPAILVMVETKYACNLDYVMDHICL